MDYNHTKSSGARAEQEVYELLVRYAERVYRNIHIDTLYTFGGTTEIDLLAVMADALLVVEVKNISALNGNLLDPYWEFTGMTVGEVYHQHNILEQNRIHVRSLKNAWVRLRKEIPHVLSIVVVPNRCKIPEDIHDGGVVTLSEFGQQLRELSELKIKGGHMAYVLDYLIAQDKLLHSAI